MLGVPFAGSLVASPFHPQVLLLALFNPTVATKWNILLAYLMGLVGAYRLARRFGATRAAAVAAAYAFGFGGFLSSMYTNPPYLVPLTTAPWMLAAALRVGARGLPRDIAALGCWWALVFLGGDAQLTIECGIVGAGLIALSGVTRRKVVTFALGGILAAALAAPELFPALAMNGEFNRSLYKAAVVLGTGWALHPLRLAELFIPHFIPPDWQNPFGVANGRMAGFFAPTIFAGGIGLALAVVGAVQRTRLALFGALGAMLAIWLSLGHYGRLLELVWGVVPMLVKFRFPEKFVAVFALMTIPLVALGTDALRRTCSRRVTIGLVFAGGALLVASLQTSTGTARWALDGVVPPELLDRMSAALGEAWRKGLLQTGVALLVLAGGLSLAKRSDSGLAFVPVLLFVELWLGNGGMPRLSSASAMEDVGDFARTLVTRTLPGEPPPRVLPLEKRVSSPAESQDDVVRGEHQQLLSNDGARARIVPFENHSSAELWRVIRTLNGKRMPDHAVWYPRLNVCYEVASVSRPVQPGETMLDVDPSVGLTLRQDPCTPRAYLARATPVPDTKAAQDRVSDGLPEDLVVWEGGPLLDPPATGTVHWIDATPDRLKLSVQTSGPAALVVSDAFASGWTASVDGQPAPVYATDAMVRGVALNAGTHIVDMRYRAPGLLLGVVVGLLGVVVALVLTASRFIPFVRRA
jgi:hypothetical protein